MGQRAEVDASEEPASPGEAGSTAGPDGGGPVGGGLIGREEPHRRAVALLRDPAVRLLTLTGPGGIGKTALARGVAGAVSDAFPGGVDVVELAAEREPGRILAAVVEALGLEPEGDEASPATLARALGGRRLLVLDNLEQLVAGAGAVGALLVACPGLVVLATSRIRLGLAGERELAVPPLALPDPAARPLEELGEAGASAAVALFVRRARQANPAFALSAGNAAAVVEVCRRLDGLPLALELGAARLRLLSPEALLARLAGRAGLLSGGPRDAPARHRTIRDTVAWSVDLLRPEERRVFGCLAVFAGGCAVDDLAAVAAAVAVEAGRGAPDVAAAAAALRDGSLLGEGADANGDARLAMLGSIRDVAGEMLAADGLDEVARRHHARRYVAVAEREGPRLRAESGAQLRAWNRLNADAGNFRAALAWFAAAGDATSGLRLAAGLDWFWTGGIYHWEGIDWIERLVALAEAAGGSAAIPRRVWGDAHRVLAMLQEWLGRVDEAERASDEAIRALAASGDHAALAEVLVSASGAAQERGRLDLARRHAERCLALADAHGLDWLRATMGINLVPILAVQGEHAAALERATAAIEGYRRIGEKGYEIAAINILGFAQLMAGQPAAAAESVLAALDMARPTADGDEGEDQFFQTIFANAGQIARRMGEHEIAVRLLAAAAAERRRTGVPIRRLARDVVDAELATLRVALGEARFAAAWAVGSGSSRSAQIALADGLLRSGVSPTLTGSLAALSERQLDVLRLVMAGASDKEIGERLFISRRTASQHVANILAALGRHSRTAAAGYAAANGLRPWPLEPPSSNPESSG